MFLHIVAVDRQLSVHAKDRKPLSAAISEAFRFHKKRALSKSFVVVGEGEAERFLDPTKTPVANKLADNDVIYVRDSAQQREISAHRTARKSTRKRR